MKCGLFPVAAATLFVVLALPILASCGMRDFYTDAGIQDAGFDGGADGGVDGGTDGGQKDNPLNLRPVTADQARRLGAYVRKTLVQKTGDEPKPMAWSEINTDCVTRAHVVNYVVAGATDFSTVPLMYEPEITEQRLNELKANPALDSGMLIISGPLVTWAKMFDSRKDKLSYRCNFVSWPIHYIPVLNVDGEYMVFDMSVGDNPVPIYRWIAGLIEPAVKCERAKDYDEFSNTALYWNLMWGSIPEPPYPDRPDKPCLYHLAPAFYSDAGDPLDYKDFRSVAVTMTGKAGIFRTLLSSDYDFADVALADIPYFNVRYNYGTEDEVCEQMHLSYCSGR
jgi:hypothetical protein